MSHKNINVSTEVYEKLARLKLPGESFTNLLARLVGGEKTKRGVDFNKYYGTWKISDEEMAEIDENLKKFWKTWRLP